MEVMSAVFSISNFTAFLSALAIKLRPKSSGAIVATTSTYGVGVGSWFWDRDIW